MNLEKIKVIDSSSLEFIEQKRRSKCSVYAPGAQKKPFGYRVVHHGYLLMSCPRLT